jgi:hypothetical protein
MQQPFYPEEIIRVAKIKSVTQHVVVLYLLLMNVYIIFNCTQKKVDFMTQKRFAKVGY